MASPMLSSFCCEFKCDTSQNSTCALTMPFWQQFLNDAALSYNIICIVSSVFGIFGAIYQLKLRLQDCRGRSSPLPEVIQRQSQIIFWLAAADGLASLGILIRSCAWMILHHTSVWSSSWSEDLLCAIYSGWILYFYICTFLWTFMFAIDTYRNAADKDGCAMWLYHLLSWGISLILCASGLIVLYQPGLESCGNSPFERRLPHFLSTYVPMFCVMVINPALLWRSSVLVKKDLNQRGSSANEQKQIIGEVLWKFFSVVLIFYVCWLPNLINGILLFVMHCTHSLELRDPDSLVFKVTIAIWQMMALLNPLQGFLNCLVYSDVAIWPNSQLLQCRRQNIPEDGADTVHENNECQVSDSSSEREAPWETGREDSSPLLLYR